MNTKRIFKILILILSDIVVVLLSGNLSLYLNKIDGSAHQTFLLVYLPFEAIVLVSLFAFLGLYRSLWRYAGARELMGIALCVGILTVGNVVVALATSRACITFSFVFINSMIIMCATGFSRFAYRFLRMLSTGGSLGRVDDNKTNVMIIGAGDAGLMIIKELLESRKLNKVPVCIIDDDESKQRTRLSGIPIVGKRDNIVEAVKQYKIDEIIIAMPSADAKSRAAILQTCKDTRCKVSMLPGIYQLVDGTVSYSKLRNVEIADLLGREQVQTNIEEIIGYIEGKVVMVTGGGGSIGSELCRQIASHNPKQLIILDIYENNAYDIEQELKRKLPYLNLLVLIASIRDEARINDIFEKYHPQIVFNAAAHKHVPLMETSPNEAIKNNVFGTLNVARAADKYGTSKFVQISTDKAVNPTNIMGASKRICEMIIQTIGKHSKTCDFVAVRFGNVLGSNGSVIPLFAKQIAEGGPVTVTHKEIIRYFMTISEAVSLVLQAGAYAKKGQIFVLDMGDPVKIYDLAVNMIKLSGYIPNEDIKIQITGLRPGEKLFEERLMDEEGLEKTPNGLISIARPIKLDEDNLFKKLDELYKAAHEETDNMKVLVSELVTTYKVS